MASEADRICRRKTGLTSGKPGPGKVIPPGSTIGILGGGQLGRMIALAAAPLGYRCVILTPEHDSPASQVAAETIVADYDNQAALRELAHTSDVVTLEFENVPAGAVTTLSDSVRTAPGDHILSITQDRYREKSFCREVGLRTVEFASVDNGDLAQAGEAIGYPLILKTRRMGYDGKGQARVSGQSEAQSACADLGDSLIAEAVCNFEAELSVIVARSAKGQVSTFDTVENDHENHILRHTYAPARVSGSVRQEAEMAARLLAQELDLVGLLAVEFFWSADAGLLVNEMAPRPHNSGHWSIDACATSQFEQVVRAICGLPLGSTARHADAVMTNILGDEAEQWSDFIAEDRGHLHLYGKREARVGRKMGHVTRLHPLGALSGSPDS